jgi:hypothetical protein
VRKVRKDDLRGRCPAAHGGSEGGQKRDRCRVYDVRHMILVAAPRNGLVGLRSEYTAKESDGF